MIAQWLCLSEVFFLFALSLSWNLIKFHELLGFGASLKTYFMPVRQLSANIVVLHFLSSVHIGCR